MLQDVKKTAGFVLASFRRLGVQKNVRLAASLAAAALDCLWDILPGSILPW
jgi:hypothetical protein